MNILVIGGTRFMGPIVVGRLVDQGHKVTVLHRGESGADFPPGVSQMIGDRNRLSDFSRDFERLRPDVVLDMILLTEQQARELVQVMSGKTRRIVVVSSCDVYLQYDLLRGVESGPVSNEKLTEKARLRTKPYPYRETASGEEDILYHYDKIRAEQEVMSHQGLPATVLRLPMVYGPGDYQHRFYGYIKRMIDDRPAILLEESQSRWRVTRGYRDNCAEAICRAVISQEAAGRIYNVGETVSAAEAEWVARMARVLGWSGNIIGLPGSKLPAHLKSDMCWQHHLVIDSTRIRYELGYKEIVEADEALRRTVEWERENPPAKDLIDIDYDAEDRVLADYSGNPDFS